MIVSAFFALFIVSLNAKGIDLVLNQMDEIKIIEVNGQPGLEIRNINEKSLADIIVSWGGLPVLSNTGHLRPQSTTNSDVHFLNHNLRKTASRAAIQ
ncbi:hypothetical protein ACFLTQ_01355 [Chloroflexota bacterium]